MFGCRAVRNEPDSPVNSPTVATTFPLANTCELERTTPRFALVAFRSCTVAPAAVILAADTAPVVVTEVSVPTVVMFGCVAVSTKPDTIVKAPLAPSTLPAVKLPPMATF